MPGVGGLLFRRTRRVRPRHGLPHAGSFRITTVLLTLAALLVSGEGAAALDLQSPPSLKDPITSDPGTPPGAKELPQLRTRDTRTYVTDDDEYITRFFQGSVNYKDPSGDWKPIDNEIVPVFTPGFAYKNAANRYLAEFPTDLKDPVRFSVADESVTMELEGADGAGYPTGNTARFTDALPGVAVDYLAESDALKETLTLSGPGVQQSFRFRLETSPGLSAHKAFGGVDFERKGEVVFSLAPPSMSDSSQSSDSFSTAIDLDLAKVDEGYVLELTPDRDWLLQKERVWPVVLDPSVYFRTTSECSIFEHTSPTICRNPNNPFLYVGKNGTGPRRRSLLAFSVGSQIPHDADVTQARLTLYANMPPPVAADVSFHEITKEWNSNVTWQTTNGNTPWSQAGGDFVTTPLATLPVPPVAGHYTWNLPASVVRGWVDGSAQNRGMLMKTSESGADYALFISSSYIFSTYWPQLEVTWRPRGRYTSAPAKTWVLDGGTGSAPTVNAIKPTGERLYVGGDFNFVGPRTGNFASVSATPGSTYGKVAAGIDEVAGKAFSGSEQGVNAITSDGAGGWFIGGSFKYVGGQSRAGLAHILANGTVDPTWDPQVNRTVRALARSGDDLFIGGSFTTVNGAAHSRVAKLNLATGAVSAWNPGTIDWDVYSIAASSDRIIIGGSFTSIGGSTRNRIAALHPISGALLSWYPASGANPGANGSVRTLALGPGGELYAGGDFSTIGQQPRNGIARLSVSSNNVDPWAPSVTGGIVDAVALSGSTVYVGGSFTGIGGVSRNGFVALNDSSGEAGIDYPNPGPGARVRALLVSGSLLYLGGSFVQLGGQDRRYAAAVRTSTAPPSVDNWNPVMGHEVYALGLSSEATPRVGIGGRFRAANGIVRRNLAEIDATTGVPTSWNAPVTGGSVYALELAEGNLYVGGDFSSAKGQPRTALAAFTTATGELTNWNPQASSVVALHAALGRLYVGAWWMESINESPTRRVEYVGAYKLGVGMNPTGNPGSYEASFGELTRWEPKPDAMVTDIETDGKAVYLAGPFTGFTQGATWWNHWGLAAVDAKTGSIFPQWAPRPCCTEALSLELTGDALYVGGNFSSVAGQPRSNVAALVPNPESAATATAWNPGADGEVAAIEADDSGVYLAGSFGGVGGLPRPGLAAVSLSGAVGDFKPTDAVGSWPRALSISDKRLYASTQSGFASYPNYGRIVEPETGTRTRKRLVLKAATEMPFFTRVQFEFCRTDNLPAPPPPPAQPPTPCQAPTDWAEIPPGAVWNESNQSIGSWPQNVSSGASQALVWDVPATPALAGVDAKFQIRAVFIDPLDDTRYATSSATAELDRKAASEASVPIGPGKVDLLSGNFNVSVTDVAIDAFGSDFNFTRTYNSRDPDVDANGPLGPGWQMGMPVDAAASEWAKLELFTDYEEVGEDYVEREYVIVTTTDGAEAWFAARADATYHPEPGSEDLKLAPRQESDGSNPRFELTDLDGNVTVFKPATAGSSAYVVDEIRAPGNANTTTFTYYGNGKVKEMYGPGETSQSCNAQTIPKRCRNLTFNYEGAGGTGRLATIDFTTVNPNANVRISSTQVRYAYTDGRLVAVDTIPVEPSDPWLRTSYGYASGRLTSVDPPGPEPAWTIVYGGATSEDPNAGRLESVHRPAYENGSSTSTDTAFTTLAYGVPLSGSGRPAMAPGNVSQWGQTDLPTDATAIFPPKQGAHDWDQATIHYMDARGRAVNVASPGGGISTTEWDEYNNPRRELSASNRATALLAADPEAESQKLDTQRTYSTDGKELLVERGPLHEIHRENGQPVTARAYSTFAYDEPPERPDGKERLHLLTTTTTGAELATDGTVVDKRTSKMSYTGQNDKGFMLRQPTSTTVDPGGLNLTTHTIFRDDGLVSESRTPAGPNGGDAHTTKTYYYGTDSPVAECTTRVDWTGLPCQVRPGGQPTLGLPDIPITTYEYNRLFQVVTETEKNAGGSILRISRSNRDDAGRLRWEEVVQANGTDLPKRYSGYDSATGRLVTTWADGSQKKIERRYDPLGRPDRYRELDGTTVENEASTTYDLQGRPKHVQDGKGTQTLTYHADTGLLTSVDDSALPGSSDFTASYDVDGRMTLLTYPNGLRATTEFDEAGAPTRLHYLKTGSCGATCEWLNFANKESIHGQVLQETTTRMGSVSTMRYTYDRSGRLTDAQDTPAGQGCTTRSYAYDAEGNRTSLTRRPPSGTGTCVTSGGSPDVTYSYDEANRLRGGAQYDSLGRILSLPGVYAGGEQLTTSYFENDLVRSQTQKQGATDVTNTYDLDPTLRQSRRVTTQIGAPNKTEVYHYGDDSDSPAWTEKVTGSVSTWSRSIGAMGAGLVAIQNSSAGVELQLADLHGDIVGTASTDPDEVALLKNLDADEFGVPKQADSPTYSWLGTKERRTELTSGVVQMGARSYVPSLGRFLQPDPIPGGALNAYDYAGQDPVNAFDLDGHKKKKKKKKKPPISVSVGTCTLGKAICSGAKRAAQRVLSREYRKYKRSARSSDVGPNPLDLAEQWGRKAAKAARDFVVRFGPIAKYKTVAERALWLWNTTPEPVRRCAVAAGIVTVLGLTVKAAAGSIVTQAAGQCIGVAIGELAEDFGAGPPP